jgi:hypothetical protein
MTVIVNAPVEWLLSGLGGVFLVACAWHNQRRGYQKLRAVTSALDDTVLYLDALKQSLSSLGECRDVADHDSMTSNVIQQAQQLVCLNSALLQQLPADQAAEVRLVALDDEAVEHAVISL